MFTPPRNISAMSRACSPSARFGRPLGGFTMDTDFHEIPLSVNGPSYPRRVESRMLLSDFLRHELGLAGTHAGCEHGVCGACTVLLDGEPVRSCLMLAVQAPGHEVATIESLTPLGTDLLHPLQQAFSEMHGLQCGFCTPGMILTAAGL